MKFAYFFTIMNRILTRMEEFLLLAVLKLKNDAYPVPIYDDIIAATGTSLTLGAIYLPLQRLEEQGLLKSTLRNPTAERGGKSRRYYRLTDKGMEALAVSRGAWENMWDGVEWIKIK